MKDHDGIKLPYKTTVVHSLLPQIAKQNFDTVSGFRNRHSMDFRTYVLFCQGVLHVKCLRNQTK
jgi:hypothetical protein